jgi:hypothetical protein
MMISMDKQYRTKCGYKVRIYSVDSGGYYPIHGAYWDESICEWILCRWNKQGLALAYSDLNLIEVKPRIQREEWVNVYKDYASRGWSTKKEADERATLGRKACVKITIDCVEGDGL